jgi:DNA-binding PadR family transcriptional regulator
VIDRKFFLGFIKIHILYHAAERPVVSVELAQELSRHGYNISPGTLYPTLHRTEKEHSFKSYTRVVNGKMRKYYEATGAGKQVLGQSTKSIKELVDEVLGD